MLGKMKKHMNLTLNRDLINPNFNGYKLSLDSMPVYQQLLTEDIDRVELTDNQYSYQHLKAFGAHNHLFIDPWTTDLSWFVDSQWHVQRVGMSVNTSRLSVESCYQIPEAGNRRLTPGRVNVTLTFTSADKAVLSDGTGWLFILNTGNRNESNDWKESYSGQPLGENIPFSVLHSVEYTRDQILYVEVLYVHVETDSTSDNSNFITKLNWLTFTSDSNTSFVLSRTRTLKCGVCPEFVALDSEGVNLVLTCERSVKFLYDSLKPVVEHSSKKNDAENQTPAYTWIQKDEELTVRFEFAESIRQSDLSVTLQTNHLDVRLGAGDNTKVLLSGNTAAAIDASTSTWTLLDGKVLEVILYKSVSGSWTGVVEGDERGQEIIDPEKLELINQQLAAYTSDTWNSNPDDDRLKTFNAQQLEECDALPEEDLCIYWFNGESHQLIDQLNISGNQWLFSAAGPNAGESPIICLRHDVDGVVWQPSFSINHSNGDSSDPSINDSLEWRHVATFNAFGYVQASKQQKRYTVCSKDYSFVALADDTRHIYVYKQPEQILSPIRNRKTGETVAAVAKQQLVSLESTDCIVGVRCTRKRLFVLAGKTVYTVAVYE